jgi:guanyl-specific ribonuclease Sa
MKKILLLLVVIALGWYQLQGGQQGSSDVSNASSASTATELSPQEQELHNTLQRIAQNGPFPYSRDGITFHNRERILPIKASGYYREYTVDTPGLSHRGPRRVVTGGDPPEVFYYTEDHYQSFVRIQGH